MEVLEENMHGNGTLTVNNEVKDFMLQIAKWAKFLSIIGFIGLGFMIIAGLGVMVMGETISQMNRQASVIPLGLVGFLYLLMAVLYFFPILYLYKSSVELKKGLNSNNQESFNNGFKNLKSHYKFIGILMIVLLSLYLLIFLLGFIFAGAMSSSMH